MTVELCSLEISVRVWKSLSCRAVGLSNLSAACFKRSEAWYSPSAAMIFPTLPLGLGLARHRSLHCLRDLHVLYLHHADLHPPGFGVLIDYHLKLFVYSLTVGQKIVKVFLAEDAP